jgi:hypothetical protein
MPGVLGTTTPSGHVIDDDRVAEDMRADDST